MELRRHPRYSTSLDVVYYTGHDDEGRIHYFGTIVDMSKGGARLVVEYPHQPDERLWLHGVGGTAEIRPTRVRWIGNHQDKYNVGVEFIEGMT